jgi:hypothetical protein
MVVLTLEIHVTLSELRMKDFRISGKEILKVDVQNFAVFQAKRKVRGEKFSYQRRKWYFQQPFRERSNA